MQLLLEYGAEVDFINPVRKVAAIHLCVQNGRPKTLELLLRFNPKMNLTDDHGRSVLHILISQWTKAGVEQSRWSYLDLLLSQPQVDVNCEDHNETTPLELAVRKNVAPLARKLLQAGALITQHVREAMEVFIHSFIHSFY